MIIYNVTVKLDHSIATDWLAWLKDEHIPDIIQTQCFFEANILKLLEVDEADGVTYAVQYRAHSRKHYDDYIRHFADSMRKKATDKWGNRFIAYRSVMELVN